MRSVWRIWLKCRLYTAGKGEDPRLNPAELHIWSSSISTDNHLSATTKIGLKPKKRVASDSTRVAPSGCLPSVHRRPDGSFMLGTSALCSECQMISFMA